VDKKEGCTNLMVLRGEITEANVSTVLSKRRRQSCEMEKHLQRK
jgi:spore coat protein CotF